MTERPRMSRTQFSGRSLFLIMSRALFFGRESLSSSSRFVIGNCNNAASLNEPLRLLGRVTNEGSESAGANSLIEKGTSGRVTRQYNWE